MSSSDTEFTSVKQPKGRGKSKKTLMLDAIKAECKSEEEFLKGVVRAAIGDPEGQIPPNAQLMTLVLNRIEPPLKSVLPVMEFNFPIDGTAVDKSLAVVDAISKGEVPVDIGQTVIGIIKDSVIIEEATDLKERIAKLEGLIDG